MAKRQNVIQILEETMEDVRSIYANKNEKEKELNIIRGLKLAQKLLNENWDDLD